MTTERALGGMEEVFGHCQDVTIVAGLAYQVSPLTGKREALAIVRLLFQSNEPVRPWPEKFEVRHITEPKHGIDILSIAPPGEVCDPWAALEWTSSTDDFLRISERNDFFVFEAIMPEKRMVAIYGGGVLRATETFPLTRDQYDSICNMDHPHPTTSGGTC